jgi:RNA polymerase sigma factor (sigma-70 family)
MEDAMLLRNYAETGSDQAFDQLVSRHFDMVYCSALRMAGGDAHLAQDVAQRVFTDLARKAGRLPQGLFLGGWLYRHTCFTAANAVRTERRRRNRERQATEMTMDSSNSEAIWPHLAPVLDEAMGKLKAADRDAIVLRFFDQQTFHAVGEALGTSEEGARKRVERALEKMRDFFVARGLSMSTMVLANAMETHAAGAAPAGLSGIVAASALAGAAKSGGMGILIIRLLTMTKTKIALAGLLAALAATFIVESKIHARQAADIAYNLTMRPSGIFSIYAETAKEKVLVPLDLPDQVDVHVKTDQLVTRTEALKLLDAALLEQAQITIQRSADGTLVGTPKEPLPGPPDFVAAMRTFLPDGRVDPPLPLPPGPRLPPLIRRLPLAPNGPR